MDKFIYFLNYLKRETRDEFYIDLSEIERIAEVKLSKSAYIHPAYWSADGVHSFADQILECGYKVSPDLKNKRIRLYRVDIDRSIVHREHRTRRAKRDDVPAPSMEQVEYWLKQWDKLEDYSAQEMAVDKVFSTFHSNDSLENILIKCSVLNDFYSTNIFKIYPVAKHILSLNIDKRIKEGDPSLVDDIAKVYIGSKEKNFYSFASKYCSHHNKIDFPIYDSYVHKVLKYYKDVDHFYAFDENELKIYPKFKKVLIEFRKFYGLEKYNLKELDKYLWQFGKAYFPKNY